MEEIVNTVEPVETEEEVKPVTVEPKEEAKPKPKAKNKTEFRYSVKVGDEWTEDMHGLIDRYGEREFAGTLGTGITGLRIDNVTKYRVRTKKGWSDYSQSYDNPVGDGTVIVAVEVVDDAVEIGVHVKGGQWLPPSTSSKNDGDGYSGALLPIDCLWMRKM